MNLFDDDIDVKINDVCNALTAMPEIERIEKLNEIRRKLHSVSPFQSEPVDCVLWVKVENVSPNDYNPNKVAPPEMRLLKRSIDHDGYTQPVVTWERDESYEVIDGYHRTRVCKECKSVRERVQGYLPITLVKHKNTDVKDRTAATIRHNRARGVHGVLPMVDIVANLLREGWADAEVAKELGMDADEVLRFKQNSGLPELFKNTEFSKAWE